MLHQLEKYSLNHSSPEPAQLQELSRETHLRVIHPRMLSEWHQGALLQLLSLLVMPKYILEIGTFTGYSALCLAKGLQPEGHLHTYDINDEVLEIAAQFISRSEYAKQITLHHQNALEGAPTLGCTFDLIFIDGDKREYCSYYSMAVDLLRSGGLIIADNVLWSGKVLDPPTTGDKHTQALQEFNDMVANDASVEKVLLPLRDGLTIIRKI
jgi:predicted O-methyltransferase YrrM